MLSFSFSSASAQAAERVSMTTLLSEIPMVILMKTGGIDDDARFCDRRCEKQCIVRIWRNRGNRGGGGSQRDDLPLVALNYMSCGALFRGAYWCLMIEALRSLVRRDPL